MSPINTDLKKLTVLRMSNKESNQITRNCIETALILLMDEKEYEEITISELTRKAGVSRTAYYRNYESKDDILNTLLSSLIADVIQAMTQFSYSSEQELYWKTLFEAIKSRPEALTILLKAGFGYTILTEITKQMTAGIPEDNIQERFDMIFWSGAVFNVLINWLQNGMKQSVDEMVQICIYISSF